MSTLYLCGASNPEGVRLALTINRASDRWSRILLVDDDTAKHGREILGVEIAGPFALLEHADPGTSQVANLVARTTARRLAARRKIEAYGLPFAALIAPNVDTTGVEVGLDTTVYPNATIGAESSLGESSVVFMGAVVGHAARVGPCCVLAANAVLSARVELAEGVYVGTNATVLPDLKIGPRATIGAGSVAIEDVPADATVMGVPAQILGPSAGSAPETRSSQLAARMPIDSQLLHSITEIWQELLELPRVRQEDNFFDLGGSSLLALRMHEQIERRIGKEILITDIFRFPTVRSLAGHIEHAASIGGPTAASMRRAAARRELQRRRQK